MEYFSGALGFGIGANAELSNFMGKFSLNADFRFNYFTYFTESDKLKRSTTEDIDKTTTNQANIAFSYSFSEKIETQKWSVKLKQAGNVEYVALMPAKTVTRYEARLGYNTRIYQSKSSIYYNDTVSDEFGNIYESELGGGMLYRERQHNLTVGASRKKSVETYYNTDKYGPRNVSVQSLFYADLIIPLGRKFPAVYAINYDNPTYPNEYSSIELVNASGQAAMEEVLKKFPIGFRVGVEQGSRKLLGFSWQIETGLYPGYYRAMGGILEKLGNGFQFEIGFRYRFMKHLK